MTPEPPASLFTQMIQRPPVYDAIQWDGSTEVFKALKARGCLLDHVLHTDDITMATRGGVVRLPLDTWIVEVAGRFHHYTEAEFRAQYDPVPPPAPFKLGPSPAFPEEVSQP